MEVSSRTPDGWPGKCSVCGSEVRVQPSMPLAEAPCPRCGALLWFLASSGSPDEPGVATTQFERVLRTVLADKLEVAVRHLPKNLTASALMDLGFDSLDVIELLMEVDRQISEPG